MSQSIEDIFREYHRFDDGLLLSFEYFYRTCAPLSVQIVLHSRSHIENAWRKVKIVVGDVQELYAKVEGNRPNSVISLGVKLIKFGDLWCIDINGNYPMLKDPSSLDEVRQYGECYVVGRSVAAHKL